MSSLFPQSLRHSSRAAYQRQVWGEFFGDLIRSAREERTLSAEEASRAAGMAVAEWEAIEAGAVPRTREQCRPSLAAWLSSGKPWFPWRCSAGRHGEDNRGRPG